MSLVLKNVSKVFEDSKEDVLNEINLEIEKGEFVCVVGRSGCGKSTLLNLIAGLEKPTEGEILLNSRPVTGPGSDRIVRALSNLRMVGLEEYKDYAIHQLSGGMRQRVALARALTLDSEILLMDEPFSALDKQTSNRLREELQEIWVKTKRTVLFITHSVEEAVYLADRVVVMSPAGITDIVSVELERPRYVYDERFVEYRHKILEKVEEKVYR